MCIILIISTDVKIDVIMNTLSDLEQSMEVQRVSVNIGYLEDNTLYAKQCRQINDIHQQTTTVRAT